MVTDQPTDPQIPDSVLADQALWAEPPSFDSIARALGAETGDAVAEDAMPAAEAVAPVSSGSWLRPAGRGRQLLTAAAVVVASIGMFIGGWSLSANRDDKGFEVAVAMAGTDRAPDAAAELTIDDTPSGARIELDISGLDSAGEGFYYQGWVVTDFGPITIGTFHLRGSDEPVVLWAAVGSDEISKVTVTRQAAGAGAESSGEVVLAADLS